MYSDTMEFRQSVISSQPSSASSVSLNQSVTSATSQGSTTSNTTPQAAEGTLVIMVCRAKHLPNRRKLDKQSPYVTLRLGTVAKKTPSHFRAGQTPDWTHEVRFQLTRDRKPMIRLDVLDETKNDPTPIGTCEIDCSIIFGDDNQRDGKYIHDKWYDLSLNGRRAGMIYLEMTFYPSAPVLPPKLYENIEYEPTTNNFGNSTSSNKSHQSFNKNLPMVPSSPPPQHPSQSRKPSVVDDIFVNDDQPKKRNRFFHSVEEALGSSSSSVEPEPEEVEESDAKNLKQKYYAKFNRFTKKFHAKEPITHMWNTEQKHDHQRVQNIVPINLNEFESLDNLEDLQRDMENNRHTALDGDVPPPPPSHSVNSFPSSPVYHQLTDQKSPSPPPPPKHSKTPTKSPNRKPPPGVDQQLANLNLKSQTTAVPFSADTIGLDDDDDLPTKVYFMDKPVQSLSYSCNPFPTEPINMDEINPKYYAPTPNEHFGRSRQSKMNRDLDYRTSETGYLGEGKWGKNFSPSIFDRIPNDENAGFENKPHVPPKIPQGLSEREYYVLDNEKYLQDINGRRN